MMPVADCRPGQRVRVAQEIERRQGNWRTAIVGVVQSVSLEKTGSWHAHGRDNKLWLMRVRLKKDNGELTTITVDPLTTVELLDPDPRSSN